MSQPYSDPDPYRQDPGLYEQQPVNPAPQPSPYAQPTGYQMGQPNYAHGAYAQPGYGQQSYAQPDYGQPAPMNYAGAPSLAAKSKIAAGLLGIFLGCLGIHNFYLGHTGKGVAQLLITVLTFGIGAIITGPWSVIEAIMILTAQPGSSWSRDAQGNLLQQ